MKTLDLNIKLTQTIVDDNKNPMTPSRVASRWIGVILERALNEPDPNTNKPTKTVPLSLQRKYINVMNNLEIAGNGIVELEDDDFDFLDRNFHKDKGSISLQRDVAEILVAIDDAINKAKVKTVKP